MATEQATVNTDFWQNAASQTMNIMSGVVPGGSAIKTASSLIPEDVTAGIMSNVDQLISNTSNFIQDYKIEAIGATPDEMVAKFASNDALQNEDGQKLIEIMKKDPAFTEAFHDAMINEPTMANGILDLVNGTGQAAGDISLKDVVAGLSDDGNRAKFTQVLDAVAQSPDDNLDFNYTMDVASAAHKVSQQDVKQEDYKKLRDLLRLSNVKDPMLDIAADPEAALQEFMRDPSAFMEQMANSFITMEGPIGDMMRGFIHGMGQYIELIVSPEMVDFYGTHVEPLVNDAIDKLGMNDEAVIAGAEAGAEARNTPATSPAAANNSDIKLNLNRHFSYARDDIKPEPKEPEPAYVPAPVVAGPSVGASM